MYRSIFVLLSILAAHEATAAAPAKSANQPATQTHDRMKEIKDVAEYKRIVSGTAPTLVVFNSSTCTACDMHKDALAPVMENRDYSSVRFYSFDASADDLKSFREEQEISGYPMTQFFVNGKKDSAMLGSLPTDFLDRKVYHMVHGKPKPAERKPAEKPKEAEKK